MRAVIQRVSYSSVECEDYFKEISQGLNILLGIGKDDTPEDALYIANKAAELRIFEDEEGKMNLSASPDKHRILLISQFTLYGDARKGRRPSFINAMGFEEGKALYEKVKEHLKAAGFTVECGIYGGDMKVTIVNDGPVTLLIDSKKLF